MAREISRAESWEKIHTAFTQINFNAYDFDSIKESLLNYLKIYYPEDFNDYIESSELIALLELFAYVGELLSYRMDMNAHENFITVAERKESILRLAKLISYKSSRNLPARGLVKLQSIRSSEPIFDSRGRNLANTTIIWNDSNNPDWKEQFILVMNRVMAQQFGTVLPNERVQVADVLFELYEFNNTPLSTAGFSVFPYNIGVPMELVPVDLGSSGPEEKRPERDMAFTFVYANDGLGDGSPTTGFLMYTKQGTMFRRELDNVFDGKTPNLVYDLTVDNVNHTDVWLNNVDDTTREVLIQDDKDFVLHHYNDGDLRYGDWVEVDTIHGENVIFNTLRDRNKYEVENLNNDNIRMIFGDGEFAAIPRGSFDLWYRVSANSSEDIPKSSVQNVQSAFSYIDDLDVRQTFTFEFSLTNSLQNASSSEDMERIRQVAPSFFYTQNRMVNGRDYNSFLLRDPSVSKLRAINRTYAGDSKYIAWHDPREYYENVKMFGDDGALYWVEKEPENGGLIRVERNIDADDLITNYIEPLLASTDFFAVLAPIYMEKGLDPKTIRTYFHNESTKYTFDPADWEYKAIKDALDRTNDTKSNVFLYFSINYGTGGEWTVEPHPCDYDTGQPACYFGSPPEFVPSDSMYMIYVEAQFKGSTRAGWHVHWATKRLVAHSEDTRFWNTNNTDDITDYDSFKSVRDNWVVLEANVRSDRCNILDANYVYDVFAQLLLEQNLPNAGLPDIHRLSVLPEDVNGDGVPDNMMMDNLLDYRANQPWSWYVCCIQESIPCASEHCGGQGCPERPPVEPPEPGESPVDPGPEPPGPGTGVIRDVIQAGGSQGQTDFPVNNLTEDVDVYLNGHKLVVHRDYSINLSQDKIVVAPPLRSDQDHVTIIHWSEGVKWTKVVYRDTDHDTYAGDYPLDYSDAKNVAVYMNGSRLLHNVDYTLDDPNSTSNTKVHLSAAARSKSFDYLECISWVLSASSATDRGIYRNNPIGTTQFDVTYTGSMVDVYKNGNLMVNGTDFFTTASKSYITLAQGINSTLDTLEVFGWKLKAVDPGDPGESPVTGESPVGSPGALPGSPDDPYLPYDDDEDECGRPIDLQTGEAEILLPAGMSYIVDHMDEDLEVYLNGVRYYYNNGEGNLKYSYKESIENKIVRYYFTFATGTGPTSNEDIIKIRVKDWVYFTRESVMDRWIPVLPTEEVKISWFLETTDVEDNKRYKRHHGRYPLNFAWFHFVATYNLVDPAASNIIDLFVVTEAYFTSMRQWLDGRISVQPTPPTPLDLRNSYSDYIENKMISDTVILQPGVFKILFGQRSIPELRAVFKVIRPSYTTLSDNECKVRIVESVKNFFDLRYWEFGEGFFFSELSAAVHADLGPEIDSVVLVPTYSQNQFGDMYQVQTRENELFIPDISTDDIDIVSEYTPDNTRQNPEEIDF